MFEIQFQGVITHARVASSVDGETRQIAVLYNVPRVPHVPLMTLRNDDVISIDSRGAKIKPVGTGAGVRCYRIAGEITTDLPEGLPTQYLAHVPCLSALTTARTPRATIGNRDTDPRFSAYIVLAKGAMHEADWFPRKAQFDSQEPRCVPRTITFTTFVMQKSVTLTMSIEDDDGDYKETTFELVKDALLRITNIEANANPSSEHFDTYANFFANKNTTVRRPTQLRDRCEATAHAREIPTCYRNAHLSVECSNTLYP
ncbi:MAG: hypothetical protein QOI24_2316 [Acidobacteriota bacterium]|jgi:hypothetical protein|nr:hypothetical protein [Acidobacteriota bacterium]